MSLVAEISASVNTVKNCNLFSSGISQWVTTSEVNVPECGDEKSVIVKVLPLLITEIFPARIFGTMEMLIPPLQSYAEVKL